MTSFDGGENKNHNVKNLESQGHFKKQVARFEISFSNSMVEALVRSIKHNQEVLCRICKAA